MTDADGGDDDGDDGDEAVDAGAVDTRVGVQCYTLREVGDPLVDVVSRVGAAGVEGVEFAGLDGADPAALGRALDEAGVEAAAAHVPLDEVEADPGAVARTYRTLGCTDVVVPWLDPDHFRSREAVEAAGTRLAAAADDLADRGCSLHYHTHDHEFATLDGEYAVDRLLEAADGVGFEPDLGWAGAAGVDPLALVADHADRIDLVHLKDYDAAAGEPVPVGAGDTDLDTTVSAVRAHDVAWLVYESESSPDTYDALDVAGEIGSRSR